MKSEGIQPYIYIYVSILTQTPLSLAGRLLTTGPPGKHFGFMMAFWIHVVFIYGLLCSGHYSKCFIYINSFSLYEN